MSIIIKTELDDIREIVAKHPEAWKKVLDDGDIYDDEKLYYDLYEYYSSDPDYMPYGTQKARDGDPCEWITDRLDGIGAFEKENIQMMMAILSQKKNRRERTILLNHKTGGRCNG